MIQFSNYESFVTKSDISTLESSFNIYSTNMENLIQNIDASFASGDYNTSSYPVNEYNDDLVDLDISDTIAALGAIIITDLDNYDTSMTNIKNKVNEYEIEKNKLDKKITHYNSLIAKLKDGKVNYNYYLMLIWIIILFVVGYACFFSVIEEKTDVNIVSKIILFLLLLFVGYFIFNNIYLYFSGYQINYSPLK